MGVPNAGGVGYSERISTNNSLYLENCTRTVHIKCDIAYDLEWLIATPNHPIFYTLQTTAMVQQRCKAAVMSDLVDWRMWPANTHKVPLKALL